MAAGLGCFADMNGELAELRARVRMERLIAGLYEPQPKESTVNLRQSELVALIARYAGEIAKITERPIGYDGSNDRYTTPKRAIEEKLERMAELVKDLEP